MTVSHIFYNSYSVIDILIFLKLFWRYEDSLQKKYEFEHQNWFASEYGLFGVNILNHAPYVHLIVLWHEDKIC